MIPNPDRSEGPNRGICLSFVALEAACATEFTGAGVSPECFAAVGGAEARAWEEIHQGALPPECAQCDPPVESPDTVCQVCEDAVSQSLQECGP
eukprot:COSAG04_NODE_23463_length_338_cov_0.652720_1_plen_93_part_01